MECYNTYPIENTHFEHTANYEQNHNIKNEHDSNSYIYNNYHQTSQNYGELCPVDLEESDLWVNQSHPYMTSPEISIQSNLSSSNSSGKIAQILKFSSPNC